MIDRAKPAPSNLNPSDPRSIFTACTPRKIGIRADGDISILSPQCLFVITTIWIKVETEYQDGFKVCQYFAK